jgi:cellulose synthase/poly-beta-1,6-N-acetylglucosamine synthase-like glycosyltransferase
LVISKKIENSLALDYPREKLQIIIATDGSTDQTPEIVKQFQESGVELTQHPDRNGKMAAINRAMDYARGEIVVFSDANNLYAEDALRNLLVPFSDSNVGAATGAKLIVQDGRDLSNAEGIYWKYESWIKSNESILGSCSSAVGEILAIRRELFRQAPTNIINDDFYQVINLLKRDYRVVYIPSAKSFEYASATASDEITRRSRMNAGRYQAISLSLGLLPWHHLGIIWQIVSHKYFRLLLPFGYLGALLTNLYLVIWPPVNSTNPWLMLSYPLNWLLLTLQIIFYSVALVGNLVKVGGTVGKMLYVPTFLVNSNLSALHGLMGFVSKKQTNLWARVRRGNE